MDKAALKNIPTEQLKKKEVGHKFLVGIFIILTILLGYFSFQELLADGEADRFGLMMAICSLGGLVIVLPELKAIRAELKERVG